LLLAVEHFWKLFAAARRSGLRQLGKQGHVFGWCEHWSRILAGIRHGRRKDDGFWPGRQDAGFGFASHVHECAGCADPSLEFIHLQQDSVGAVAEPTPSASSPSERRPTSILTWTGRVPTSAP